MTYMVMQSMLLPDIRLSPSSPLCYHHHRLYKKVVDGDGEYKGADYFKDSRWIPTRPQQVDTVKVTFEDEGS